MVVHRLDPDERYGIAAHLLCVARMDTGDPVDVLALAHVLNVRLTPKAPRGCHGCLQGSPVRIRYDGRGPEPVVLARLGHEFGHLGVELAGAGRVPEVDVDLIGDEIQMPRTAVLRAVRAVGYDPWRLMACFPTALPSRLFTRVALVTGVPAVLHVGNARRVVANDVESLAASFRDYQLYEAVRRAGTPANDSHGGIAAPFADPGQRRGGVVVFLPSR